MRRELAEQRAEEESIAEERRAKSARKYEAPPGVLRRPQPLSIETFVSASPQHARFAPSATQTSIVLRLAQRRSASCSHLPSIESSGIYSLKAPQHARFAPSAAQISIVVASPVNVNQGQRDFFAAKARAFCA